MMKRYLIFCIVLLCLASCQEEEYSLIVENPSSVDRVSEIIEIELEEAEAFAVYDDADVELPSQITYNGKLIFPATVAAKSKSSYVLKRAERSSIDTLTKGRVYPERLDDIAWESDKIGFRAYGKRAGAHGAKFYGYDVFTKRGERPVLDHLYAVENDPHDRALVIELRKSDPKAAQTLSDAISYHIDHGLGMDYYVVGPTLGCGTAALIHDGENLYPLYYDKCEILDNGGLRFTMKLTFDAVQVGEDMVVEERIITLDAGQHFNHIEINYQGLTQPCDVVIGLSLRDVAEQHQIKSGSIAYAEPVHTFGWQTYTAAIFPELMTPSLNLFDEEQMAAHAGAFGHLQTIGEVQPNKPFIYYAGAGWNRWGFDAPQQWFDYVAEQERVKYNPLTYTLK